MNKRIRFPKIFFGWWAVIGGGILGAWQTGYTLYGFAALFKPIATTLGLTRAATSAAASTQRFEGGIGAPIVGWAADRFGPKRVVLLGVIILGFGMLAMSLVNSQWAFYLVWGIVIGTGSTLLTLPMDTATSNWFVKKRGLALSIRWFLNGLSGTVILPLVTWLITTQGWHTALVVGGLVVWLIGFPVALLCFRQYRPEHYGLLPDGAAVKEEVTDTTQMVDRGVKYAAEVQEVEFSLRQALGTFSFWSLLIATTLPSLAVSVITIHGIPFLTDSGFTPVKASGMIAMYNLIGLPLRPAGGFLADWVSRERMCVLFAVTILLETIGFTAYVLHQTNTMIYIWFIIYGMGHGLGYGFRFSIWGRYFGRKAIGSIRGIGTLFALPITIATPIWAGWMYDTTGSYIKVFMITAIAMGISIILMLAARPPRPPAKISDVSQIV